MIETIELARDVYTFSVEKLGYITLPAGTVATLFASDLDDGKALISLNGRSYLIPADSFTKIVAEIDA